MPSVKKHRREKMGGGGGNAKRQWKKMKQRRRAQVATPAIKAAWDSTKTLKENMKSMGLAVDANSILQMKKNKFLPTTIDVDSLKGVKPTVDKPNVIQEMETEAAVPEKEKKFQLSAVQVQFCTQMLDLYGEDYKSMAKDRQLNLDQLTASQMRAKIRAFKRSRNQYKKFLEERKHLALSAQDEEMKEEDEEEEEL